MTARVAVLTPPGTGAIGTVQVCGPGAWAAVRRLFRPAGQPLPDAPALHRVWFGVLGDGDEVVLAVKRVEPEPVIEIHSHGGRRVVGWVVERFTDIGCVEEERKPRDGRPWALLEQAPTLRTANVLLDQCHGAFESAIRVALAAEDPTTIVRQLAAYAPVGRHLIDPWRVVMAGAPNVGKSSLVNALAGFQRSVVSPVAGTTRDVVTTAVAFDGWPVELADTAGLRRAAESLEAEGIALARRFLADADLVVWLLDAADPHPILPGPDDRPPDLLVWNKTDAAPVADGIRVSAKTGDGIPELISAIVAKLVPVAPPTRAAVPYTPALADVIVAADRLLKAGKLADARSVLATCLTPPEPAP